MIDQALQSIQHGLIGVVTLKLGQDVLRCSTAVKPRTQGVEFLGVGYQIAQPQAVVLAEAPSDPIAKRAVKRFQQQVQQIGVTDQQLGLMTRLELQGAHRRHQQTEQFQFCFNAKSAKEFNAAMEDFLDALATFIGHS